MLIQLPRLTRLGAALALGLALPAVVHAGCTIYEHRDYGGWALKIGDQQRVRMTDPPAIDTATSHGEVTTYEPGWNDDLSSFKVTPGCRLTLWQHAGPGGPRFARSNSVAYIGDAWNDEASEALCTC